ncbi:PREDICTED: uncharacterized protein LOC108379521 [Rhagoletis zephyria]|uniref:uncharacterized protein LOC108379521 n=1 Tax=Rhagoletis zephyria TaxID=28612 RepID=UPI00081160A9|nr:PREDICTED: uncharacterized protein LOC108379521 [Rhagoletis zephyria]
MATNSAQIEVGIKNAEKDSPQQANVSAYQRESVKPKAIRAEAAALETSAVEFSEGRGKYKRRKMLKYLQPLLVGVLIVKFILLPLVLKTLTALSTSSFVMSKIALATAGLFVLKWLFSGSEDGSGYNGGVKERTHFEIVHLPLPLTKTYQRGNAGGDVVGGWSDLSLSGSNSILAVKHANNKPSKYIPVNSAKEMAHMVAAAVATDSVGGNSYRSTRPYARPYDAAFYGKPFL